MVLSYPLYIDLTMDRWPSQCRHIPGITSRYWDMYDEFCTENILLIKSERIVIPTTLHDQFLEDVHQGHIRVSKRQHKQKQLCTPLESIQK